MHEESMSGNFCVNKNDIPFCTIGPDHAIEHVNNTMKIRARWPQGFNPATSRYGKMVSYCSSIESPCHRTEAIVGLQAHSLTHHLDLSEAIITRYEENVKKLKEVFKANDPFINEEHELINMITKAVMPVTVKEAVLEHDKIGQDLFTNFVKERILERKLTVGSPMKKANLHTSLLIVMTFQILSSREFASFAKVATGPWCTNSPMVQTSKRSLSNSF